MRCAPDCRLKSGCTPPSYRSSRIEFRHEHDIGGGSRGRDLSDDSAAVSQVATPGSDPYLGAAILLSLLSGIMLVGLGLARAGFLATHALTLDNISSGANTTLNYDFVNG